MRILSFGSLNLDFVYSVDHILQAGETLSADSLSTHCGGKGLNQSVAMSKAGAEVYHAGKIGPDGQALLDRLGECGADTRYILTEPSVKTGHAIIQVVAQRGENCILTAAGANGCITEEFIDETLSAFAPGELVVLQNEVSNLPYLIRRAAQKGLTIALTPSPISSELLNTPELEYVDIFILNEIEGKAFTGEDRPQNICKALRARFPKCAVALTLGKYGAVYMDKTQWLIHGIYKTDAVDTTGAGDTFAGYFLSCISKGMPAAESLQLASKAAAISVSRMGASTSIPGLEEVLRAELPYEEPDYPF